MESPFCLSARPPHVSSACSVLWVQHTEIFLRGKGHGHRVAERPELLRALPAVCRMGRLRSGKFLQNLSMASAWNGMQRAAWQQHAGRCFESDRDPLGQHNSKHLRELSVPHYLQQTTFPKTW